MRDPHTSTTNGSGAAMEESTSALGTVGDVTMETAAAGTGSAENGAAPAAAATSNGSPQVDEGNSSFDSGVGMSGAGPPPIGMPWPGESDVDREEVVRLMVAALREIGYERSATTLELESGHSLDPHPDVGRFREAVLRGKWDEAERLLVREQDALTGLGSGGGGGVVNGSGSGAVGNGEGSSAGVLVGGGGGGGRRHLGRLGIKNVDDLREARFLIAQQKYLELLEARHVKTALSVLRTEVTPLAQEAAAAMASVSSLSVSQSNGSGAAANGKKPQQKRKRRRRRLLPGSWEARSGGAGAGGPRRMALDDDEEDDEEDEEEDELMMVWGREAGFTRSAGEDLYDEEDLDADEDDDDLGDGIDIDDSFTNGNGSVEGAGEEEEQGPLARLSVLSSFLMCGSAEEVRERSGWQGVTGGTRVRVLDDMQALIPPSHLLPHNRLPRLLEQAKLLQKTNCLYHVSDVPVSLLTDHSCPRDRFPSMTTHVLREHSDEVWRVEWHPAGDRLATAGADRKCIVWKMQDRQTRGRPRLSTGSSAGGAGGAGEVDFVVEHVLEGHPTGVAAIAWSPDGSALLTASDCTIKIWNTEDGKCICSMTKHDYEVSALAWMPDGKTFISGAMDQTVHAWSLTGDSLWSWTARSTRILDIAVTPDGRHLVAVGLSNESLPSERGSRGSEEDVLAGGGIAGDGGDATGREGLEGVREKTRRVLVYDLVKGRPVGMYNHSREITCVSVSSDSKYALVNTSPDEVQLFSLEEGRVVQQYVGQKQGKYVIKSCFGGADGNFILSGSEDGMVYAWHRETAQRIDVLRGHRAGTVVNAVAWNPRATAMFASAGDDHTVRIWQGETAALPSSMSDVF